MIRSGVVATAVAVLLAACSGQGAVPSQGAAPVSGMAPQSAATADRAEAPDNAATSDNDDVATGDAGALDASPDKNSKCDVAGLYYFHGSCVAFNLNMNANTTVELGKFGAYHGIKITTTFSEMVKPPKVKSIAAIMGDAIGNGDITGKVKNKAFPPYGDGKDCVNSQGKPETCPGKVFVYAELINTTKYTLKPKLTPKFVIDDSNGFPGKNLCFPAILTDKGWSPETVLGGKPKGTQLIINAQSAPSQLVYPPGQFIVAGACE